MEILHLIIGAALGGILWITPIPFLPLMYFQMVRSTYEKDGFGWAAFASIINILWPLFTIGIYFLLPLERPHAGIGLWIGTIAVWAWSKKKDEK